MLKEKLNEGAHRLLRDDTTPSVLAKGKAALLATC